MWRHLVAVPSAPWAPVGMVRADNGPWGHPCGHFCFCHRKSMGGSRGEGWQAAQSAVEMGCWHRARVCGTQATVPSHPVTSLLSGPGGCPMLVLAPPKVFAASPQVEDGCGGCRAGFPSSGVPTGMRGDSDSWMFLKKIFIGKETEPHFPKDTRVPTWRGCWCWHGAS